MGIKCSNTCEALRTVPASFIIISIMITTIVTCIVTIIYKSLLYSVYKLSVGRLLKKKATKITSSEIIK